MIPIYKPYFIGNEKKYINQCIDSTWISSRGSFISLFENKIAEYVDRKYASSCSNGTTALDLAFKALNITKGDEIITSAFTYVASTNSILINNAIPVFVDIETKSWNLNVDLIESNITKKTKAILISNIYGFLPDVEKLIKLCNKYNLYLIEDAAESLGSKFKKIRSGKIGIISTFSFFGNKTITTGEGGMVLTDNKQLYNKIEKLKNQGNSNKKKYYHDILGYNYRMTNIQASIGLAQLENINIILDKKKEIFNYYFKKLKDYVVFQENIKNDYKSSYWIISILFKSVKIKNKIDKVLNDNSIETRPLFHPIYKFNFYKNITDKNYQVNDLFITENFYKKGICLPSFPSLTKLELEKICSLIIKNINK